MKKEALRELNEEVEKLISELDEVAQEAEKEMGEAIDKTNTDLRQLETEFDEEVTAIKSGIEKDALDKAREHLQ